MQFDPGTLNRLYQYCYSLTGHEAQAYDLLHDGVERFLKRTANGRDDIDSPYSYLQRLLRNRFIDLYRQQSRFREAELDEADPGLLSEIDHDALQRLEQQTIAASDMERIWDTLTFIDREVLFFWAVEGMTAQEIAERLECSRNTVLSRIHRARLKIQQRFPEADPNLANKTNLATDTRASQLAKRRHRRTTP